MTSPTTNLPIVGHALAIFVLEIRIEVDGRGSFRIHSIARDAIDPGQLQACHSSSQGCDIYFIVSIRQRDSENGAEAESAVGYEVEIVEGSQGGSIRSSVYHTRANLKGVGEGEEEDEDERRKHEDIAPATHGKEKCRKLRPAERNVFVPHLSATGKSKFLLLGDKTGIRLVRNINMAAAAAAATKMKMKMKAQHHAGS